MRQDTREQRELQIEAAAYALLAEKGFGSTSMLSVARRAKCSNETLYNWFGDKVGLFRAMVDRNAQDVRLVLEGAQKEGAAFEETLKSFGPALLRLLLSDKSVLLNRAAAADASGVLGKALSEAGRGSVVPLLRELFERGRREGVIKADDLSAAVELYLGLLIGDLQIRRVIGGAEAPGDDLIEKRGHEARRHVMVLLAA